MAYKLNLVVDQGTNFSFTTPVYYSNLAVITNTTGYTVANATMKKAFESINLVSFGTNLTANGNLTLTLAPTDTANITYGMYVYDVYLKDTSNNVLRTIEGFVQLTAEV